GDWLPYPRHAFAALAPRVPALGHGTQVSLSAVALLVRRQRARTRPDRGVSRALRDCSAPGSASAYGLLTRWVSGRAGPLASATLRPLHGRRPRGGGLVVLLTPPSLVGQVVVFIAGDTVPRLIVRPQTLPGALIVMAIEAELPQVVLGLVI